MRWQRLIFESSETDIVFQLHPRLTVVGGIGRVERTVMVDELIGTLEGGRAGLRAECVADSGTPLVLDGKPEHNPIGPLLSPLGLDPRSARRLLRLGAEDLAVASDDDRRIHQLARIDQSRLWHLAGQLRESERRLESVTTAMTDTDALHESISEIDERHEALSMERSRADRMRRLGLQLGAGIAVVAVGIAFFNDPTTAIPLLVAAMIMLTLAGVTHRRVQRATEAEDEALAAAGVDSYLGFHLKRVNAMLNHGRFHQDRKEASDDYNRLRRDWMELTYGTDPGWAFDHRTQIAAASRLHEELATNMAEVQLTTAQHDILVAAVLARFTAIHQVTSPGERLPLIVDDVFANFNTAAKRRLLDTLMTCSYIHQVVMLTEDPEITNWVRDEARVDHALVIEPAATTRS